MMTKAKKELIKNIKEKGSINGDIIKVDGFLNHLVDTKLMHIIGKDIAERFALSGIDKILTVEASGIVVAHPVAEAMKIPYIYAKKNRPITMEGYFCAESYSFTKQKSTELFISGEMIMPGEKLLFVDDFYYRGATCGAIEKMIDQAGAVFAGIAVVINKSDRKDIYSIMTIDEIKEELGIDE